MGRLCERPGCSEVASIAYGFDVDQLLVWLAARDPDGDPLRAGSLCRRHADAMVVPLGWTLDDRRDGAPRLFRPQPAEAPAAPKPRKKRAPSPAEAPADQLALDTDAATPWMPDFDQQDDLGGVLAARSPLLARAFRGTDRPR
jgi:hypothetical protein